MEIPTQLNQQRLEFQASHNKVNQDIAQIQYQARMRMVCMRLIQQ